MPRVVVLGSINLDLVAEVHRLPRPGETVHATQLREEPGGKGANQAVAAARLGAKVALVGAVGDDSMGAQLRDTLAAAGVDVQAVRPAAGRSGAALVLLAEDSDNVIAVIAGANREVGLSDAVTAADLLEAGDILLCQLEVPVEAVEAAVQAAKARGAVTVLNAAPAVPLSEQILSLLDVLVVNETEAATLTGQEVSEWPWPSAVAATLLQAGPRAVIVTLGSRGALIADSTGVTTLDAFPVAALDAVGAGDAFVGALVAELASGANLPTAARTGAAAGALTVQTLGAQRAMPSRAAVDELMASHSLMPISPGADSAS